MGIPTESDGQVEQLSSADVIEICDTESRFRLLNLGATTRPYPTHGVKVCSCLLCANARKNLHPPLALDTEGYFVD